MTLSILCCATLNLAVSDDSAIQFDRDIRPILSENCFVCHGPDAAERKADLRLDDGIDAYEEQKSGLPTVVPGRRAHSELYLRIASDDPDEKMPPADFNKTLSAEEIELIGAWIDAGAQWEQHWSLKPMERPAIPEVGEPEWPKNDIDWFILAKLESRGLTHSPEADRRTLIRRLTFDLHGLPPTPEEVDAFVSDPDPDAYEKLVERLLDSPRYGERWGRHWLDVVHYGDTHGYDKDKRRDHAWPYRDYVIRALNADKPYDRFIREQIAGDVLYPEDPDGIVATGFIAAGPWDFVGHAELREGTKDKKITRLLDRDDMVVNAMGTFISATVQCARCHDHKFDPISQEDYYGLQAVFAGVDRADRAYDTDAAVHHERRLLEARQRDLLTRKEHVDSVVAAVTSPEIESLDAKLAPLREERAALEKQSKSSPSNGYHSAIAASQDTAKWVQADLGEPQAIDTITLVPARPTDFADTPGFGFPLRYRVEISESADFSRSVVIEQFADADAPNPGDKPRAVPVGGLTARYVRVTATRLWERTDDYVFALAELQVQANGVNVAEGKPVTALDSIEAGRWSTKYLVDTFSSRASLLAKKDGESQLAEMDAAIAALAEERTQAIDALLDDATKSERREVSEALAEVTARLAALPEPAKVYAAAPDFKAQGAFTPPDGPREVHVLARGDVMQPGSEARPGALECVSSLQPRFALENPDDEGARRAALAEWIADPANPFTWRSIVNRVWHYHVGRGIVDTPNDFGRMGSPPTHPELLDWLALEFLDHGASLKWLHRTIVTSATYRQVSQTNEASEQIDGGNQYLWRMNRRQLDAESIRDAVLYVSGKLDFTMGGPGFDLFAFEDDHSPRYRYSEFDVNDPKCFRRSVYRFVVRSVPDPFMECLDSADPSQNVPVRNETLTALQALALMNNPVIVNQAEFMAERVARETDTPEEAIGFAWRLALSREPTERELAAIVPYGEEYGLANACRVILNSNEFMFVD
ncbi:MAG: DUF1553 domain-containing protein [Candidatus Hydrogenedentes bacterium]|nr:DUF1553 domain-containing protein [Candidatus Hydrogenedentota bacterium]